MTWLIVQRYRREFHGVRGMISLFSINFDGPETPSISFAFPYCLCVRNLLIYPSYKYVSSQEADGAHY